MGTLFSRGPAGEASEVAAGTEQSLKGTWVKVSIRKGPTTKKVKRTYADVVKGTMRALPGLGDAGEPRKAHQD